MKDVQPVFVAKGALQSSHFTARQWQHLFDSLLAVVFIIDVAGRFTYVSKASLYVWGYNPEELIGTPCLDIVVQEDRIKTKEYFDCQIYGEGKPHFENNFYKKDGSIVPISWAGRWDKRDRMLYNVVRDITERKQLAILYEKNEIELKRHNKEMTNILERITDGFYALDNDWNIVYWNKVAEFMLGKSREEVLGRNIWSSFPEAVRLDYHTQYHKALKEQVPVYFEAYYPPCSMWTEVSIYPSENGLSVFFRNINERKHTELERATYERKIGEQNNHLSQILERITDAFFAVDKNWIITYCNRRAEELSGKSKEETVSKSLWEVFPNAFSTDLGQNLCKALSMQMPVHFEAFSTVRPALLQFSAYPSSDGLTIFYHDITQQRKTEEELQKLSLVAKETVNAVSLIELDGSISWVNNAFTHITGYTVEEAIGQRHSRLLTGPESDVNTIEEMNRNFKNGISFSNELLSYTKEKEKIWLEASCQPVYDQMGNIQRYFIIQTDITDRKRLEHELAMQQKKTTAVVLAAQERERAQVGRELHDNVNQVLTTVKLYTELCLGGIDNKEGLMKKSMQLLQDTINEIRNLSKRLSAPSLGNMRLKESVKDLLDTIYATNKLSITLESAGIENLEIDQELHLAIYRILQEHLTNILKHAEAKKVAVIFSCMNNYLALKVTDDGKGFDVKKKRGGVGITNMITRAESLQGSLTISSTPGAGSVLEAHFPLAL